MKNLIKISLLTLLLSVSLLAQKVTKPKQTLTPAKPAATASSPTLPAGDDKTPIVLKGGRLLTVSHGIIENGVLVMEKGKITAVGTAANVKIPADARVMDVTGMTVYPGLIDSYTSLGITEISAVDMSNDTLEPSDEITPHMHVADAFHAESEIIPVTRYNGITNAMVVPGSRNTLPGQMTFIQLAGKDADEMMLVRDIAMPLNFTGQQRRNDSFATSKYPSTRMGMATQLRQAFIDAQEYGARVVEYDKKIADWEKTDSATRKDKPQPPKRDLKLEALLPYLHGKKPVLLTAQTSQDVKTALRLAKEFSLKVVLCGLEFAQNMLDEIASSKLSVIVGSIYATPENGARYDSEFSVPAELYKHGIKIAFASYDSHNARNLPYAAGYAVAFGLPEDEALKAITLNPAEIWGFGKELGSLDVGKTANVVVANGNPLELRTDVKQVFIDGKPVPMENKQTRLRDAYMQR